MVRDALESTIHLSSQLSTLRAVSDETMTWLSGSEAMATRRICIVFFSPSLSSEAASEFAFVTVVAKTVVDVALIRDVVNMALVRDAVDMAVAVVFGLS